MRKIFVPPSERVDLVASLVPMEDLLEALDIPVTRARSGPCLMHAGSSSTDFSWKPDGSWRCRICGKRGGKVELVCTIQRWTKDHAVGLLSKLARNTNPLSRFRQCCETNELTRRLLARLMNKGCNDRLIFEWLRAYIESSRALRGQLKKDSRPILSRIRGHMRRGLFSREFGNALLARTNRAF